MIVGFDVETERIALARQAPPLVCVSYADEDECGIEHWTEARPFVEELLESRSLLVGHHVAFDMAVVCAQWPDLVPLVFHKYERDEVSCTEVRAKLIHIAGGVYRGYEQDDGTRVGLGYGLDDLARRNLAIELDKENFWRLRYEELRDIPLAFWPEDAKDYAIGDAVVARAVWQRQEEDRQFLADEFRQARASFFLELMSAWGFATDVESVRQFARMTQQKFDAIAVELKAAGLMRENGVRNVKAVAERVEAAYRKMGRRPPSTPKGKWKTDFDTCDLSQDPVLQKYAELSSLKKNLSTDVPLLSRTIVHPHFESLVETGRTASSPNVQNLPTEPGVRECFAPRPGWVYAICDYPQIELRTWSQVCYDVLGHSRMGEALKSGLDPHTDIARRILGISYDEARVDYKRNPKGRVYFPRQCGKVTNFGCPGGLGARRLVDYARKNYGVVIPEKKTEGFATCAEELREFWYEAWDGREYFAWVKAQTNDPRPQIKQLRVDRYRGDVSFTEGANGFFQGLAADIAKAAGFLIAKACYADASSPLYGCRPVNFAHDEFVTEVPDDGRAHDAAHAQARLMEQAARPLIPDLPCEVEPMLARRWSKLAKPSYGPDGRLVPWEYFAEAAE